MSKFLKLGLILMSSVLLVGCEKEEVQEKEIPTYSYEKDNASYVLENDALKLTVNPDTTYFQVLDKSNNYIWDSNPAEGANDPNADEQSKKYLQSTLLIEYSDDTGIKTLYNNFQYSISKGTYQITQGNDYIQVDYTIGDLQKVYFIPPAAPESRMNEFLDKMDSSGQRQVKKYYRKIDINNLRPTDDKTQLISQYPDLEKECVYALRDATQDYLKEKIQEIFAAAGYTEQNYQEDLARYGQTSSEEKPYFNISMIYRLDGNDLVVEMPFDNMGWKETYPLTKIKVLPYLGAGTTTDQGFFLVPEGNGAIINFNNGKSEQNPYYTEVYGWDYGMERDSLTDLNDSTFPVFGISKNEASLLCILEDSASVATIEADVSGRNHSYNYADASYTTIHDSALKVSAKTDKSVIIFESKKPSGALKQRFRFLDTNTYPKMAEAYRNYLMDKYPELTKREDSSTPVNVTLVGAIDEIKQRFGFPVSVLIPLTTYQEAYDIIGELKEKGYNNLSVKYSGWMNGGMKQTALRSIKPASELGSKNKLQDLIRYGNELGVPVYLEGAVENIYNLGTLNGFVINRDAAKYSSRQIIKLYDFSEVYYGPEDWNDCYYFIKPQLTVDYIQTLADYAKKNSAQLALRDAGYILGGNYDPKNLTTRQQVIELQQKELERVAAEGTGIMVNGGNDYVLPYVDFISDMDLSGSKYQIIDDMVPFYSIAIHGLVDYSGTSLNLSGNYQELILKSAEAGAGLSFTFMKESTDVLQDSYHTYLFGTDYDRWKDKAYEIYSTYQANLGHCFNQYITDHTRLAEGVFVTTYEDGTKVYVNYNSTDFQQDGLTVPAKDYRVEGR